MRHILLSLALVLFLNIFLFRPYGPIPTLLTSIAFLAYWYHTQGRTYTHTRWTVLFAATLILSQLSHIFYSSRALELFGTFGSVALLGLIMLTSSFNTTSALDYLFSPFTLIAGYLGSTQRLLTTSPRELFHEKTRMAHQRYMKYFIGTLISLPIVGILLKLLSADPIFASKLSAILSPALLGELSIRFILSTLITIILLPLMYFVYETRAKRESGLSRWISHSTPYEFTLMMGILMGGVLFLFIIIQWPYIFAQVTTEIDLHQYGVATFSEYVTKGFHELLIASILIFSVISYATIIRSNMSVSKLFYVVYTSLTTGYVLLLLSCVRRIWLYIQFHGLSVVRFYGIFALVALGVLVPFALVRLYRNRSYLFFEVTSLCVIYTAMMWTSADSFIARSYPPTVNKKIDYTYLSSLSSDGYEGWMRAYEFANQTLTAQATPQKALYDASDRQQIAYAGIVVQRLLANYMSLSEIYLTPAEYQQDKLILLQGAISTLKSRIKNNQLHIEADRLKSATIAGKLEVDTQSRIHTNGSLSQDLALVQDCLQKTDVNNPFDQCHDFLHIVWDQRTDSRYPTYTFFDQEKLSGGPLYQYAIYTNMPHKNLMTKNASGVWRSFNVHDAKAFQLMRAKGNEFLPQLVDLIGTYNELEMYIVSQPENERDYERDISLDTPLL